MCQFQEPTAISTSIPGDPYPHATSTHHPAHPFPCILLYRPPATDKFPKCNIPAPLSGAFPVVTQHIAWISRNPPRARRAYWSPRRDTAFARLSFFRLLDRPCTESRVDPRRDQTGGSGVSQASGLWVWGSARYKTLGRPTVLLTLREKQLPSEFVLPFKPSPSNYSSSTISLTKTNPLTPNT